MLLIINYEGKFIQTPLVAMKNLTAESIGLRFLPQYSGSVSNGIGYEKQGRCKIR